MLVTQEWQNLVCSRSQVGGGSLLRIDSTRSTFDFRIRVIVRLGSSQLFRIECVVSQVRVSNFGEGPKAYSPALLTCFGSIFCLLDIVVR